MFLTTSKKFIQILYTWNTSCSLKMNVKRGETFVKSVKHNENDQAFNEIALTISVQLFMDSGLYSVALYYQTGFCLLFDLFSRDFIAKTNGFMLLASTNLEILFLSYFSLFVSAGAYFYSCLSNHVLFTH